MNQFKLSLVGAMAIVFVGCQSTPMSNNPTAPKAEKKAEEKSDKSDSKVVVTPFPDDGIRRESQPLPPRLILPENQNNHKKRKRTSKRLRDDER